MPQTITSIRTFPSPSQPRLLRPRPRRTGALRYDDRSLHYLHRPQPSTIASFHSRWCLRFHTKRYYTHLWDHLCFLRRRRSAKVSSKKSHHSCLRCGVLLGPMLGCILASSALNDLRVFSVTEFMLSSTPGAKSGLANSHRNCRIQ